MQIFGEKFSDTLVGRELHALHAALNPIEKQAMEAIHSLYAVVIASLEKHGPELIQAIGLAMYNAAKAAFHATESNDLKVKGSNAGKAALAAGEAAVISAGLQLGTDIGQDLLHTLATSQVAAVQSETLAPPADLTEKAPE